MSLEALILVSFLCAGKNPIFMAPCDTVGRQSQRYVRFCIIGPMKDFHQT